MDKRVIFAVAGSGKTTHITNHLSQEKRYLIITYTDENYVNLHRKIIARFGGSWPTNVTLMTYFVFLFRFCYKPFLSDVIGAKGICYEQNLNRYAKKTERSYFMTSDKRLYSNRLAYLLDICLVMDDLQARIKKYFDEIVVDEVQDIAGRDFNFLEQLMALELDMLFVGDYFQHTFDTSRDGNVNKSLFDSFENYKYRFADKDLTVDTTSLSGSWRCSKSVCTFVRESLGIPIYSARPDGDDTSIEYVSDEGRIADILQDGNIIKLHYQKATLFGPGHKNWGQTKGEVCYGDVCVCLNKTTADAYAKGALGKLAPSTKNKLYVAITRARGNVFLIDE